MYSKAFVKDSKEGSIKYTVNTVKQAINASKQFRKSRNSNEYSAPKFFFPVLQYFSSS